MLVVMAGAAALVPTATANPACDAVEQLCVVDVNACFALTRTCHNADDPGAKALIAWAKDQLGPCTCDPQPDPW